MKNLLSSLPAALCVLAWSLACPHAWAADDALPAPPASPAPPVWLGDPGVDIEQARARVRARYQAARQWEIDQNLAAYEKIGKKNPRWDEAVRETLRNSSNFATDQPGSPAAWAAQKAACARALAAGCDDPLIVFLGLRTENYPAETSPEKLAQLFTTAERELDRSGYSPLRKFYAVFRTVQQDLLCRRAADGKAGQSTVGNTEPAAGWAEGTDVKAAFQHGLTHLETLIADPTVPSALYYGVMKSFLDLASSDPVGRAEVLDPLEKFFADGEPRTQTPAVAKMCAGRFWATYAWDARRGYGEALMSEEQKKQFFGRMKKARATLEEAWKLDPTEPEVACNLVSVSGDLSSEWSVIDRWFRRAMNVKPNNRDAASAYLRFLQPNWGGSEKDMVEFGRKCFATRDAVSRLPLVLLEVHWRMATQFSDDEAAYWRKPEVWADLRRLFDFLVKERPDIPAYRTTYAIYAWRAGDWRVAHEKFELVGDQPDMDELRYFKYSLQRYQEMRCEAAEGARTAPQAPPVDSVPVQERS